MRSIAPLVVLVAAASPLAADDVHLKNGRVFEDVIAEVGPSMVRIRLAFGEMAFSLDAVERIERGESSLLLYQQRRDALLADPEAGAAEWIELARWASRRGQAHAAREAALAAAEIDPRAEGLREIMRGLEFVFEPRLGRWIPFDESMRLRGFQLVDGQWLSPEQMLARSQAAAEAARAREADQESRLTRAVLALAAAQLAREPEPEPEPVYAWPVAVYPNPFVWRHPTPHKLPPPGHDPTALPIERRQPGSLLPVAPRAHRGGIASAAPGRRGSH